MIRHVTLLLSAVLIPMSPTGAWAEATCPWKLLSYGDNMDVAETGLGALSRDVAKVNLAVQAARGEMVALLTSDCDPATKKQADALGAQIADAIAAHAKLAETTQSFAPCDQLMSAKVQRESAAAVEAGNSTLVLKLSGIDKAIRELGTRGFAVDHEMVFLRSKLDRLEGERNALYAACVGGIDDVDF